MYRKKCAMVFMIKTDETLRSSKNDKLTFKIECNVNKVSY